MPDRCLAWPGPYTGTSTATGAATAPATLIAPLPPDPTATYYNANGTPKESMPAPYVPGGLRTNGTEPRYMVNSDWDF
ncbi:unnamed protein product [Penicillium palitans]